MADNPLVSALRPLAQTAVASVVGPLGVVVAPLLGTLSLWAGHKYGSESEGTKAASEVLSHVFGHLGGDAAKEVFSSLHESGNHDLERSMATAIKRALRIAQQGIAPTNQILVDRYDQWFGLWDKHLDRALDTPEVLASLFYVSDKPDPVELAGVREDDWWLSFQLVLLRWIEIEQKLQDGIEGNILILPSDLDAYLAKNLLVLVRESFNHVLREPSHHRGWVAWQQHFLEAVARQISASHAEAISFVGKRADEILNTLACFGPEETLPHHYLELLTQESERGLIIALRNPKDRVIEECRVVLRELAPWSSRKRNFAPQELPEPMVLLACSSIAAQTRSMSAYLVMVNRADRTELLLHESGCPPQFLKTKGMWRADLAIKAKHRRASHISLFFEWNPGKTPRFVAAPKLGRTLVSGRH